MSRRDWLMLGGGLFCVATVPVVGHFALKGRQPKAPQPDNSAEEKLLQLINEARAAKQQVPLKLDGRLAAVARNHSEQMANDNAATRPERWWVEEQLQLANYHPMLWGLVIDRVERLEMADVFDHLAKIRNAQDEILSSYRDDLGVGVYHDEASGAYFITVVLGRKKRGTQ